MTASDYGDGHSLHSSQDLRAVHNQSGAPPGRCNLFLCELAHHCLPVCHWVCLSQSSDIPPSDHNHNTHRSGSQLG